MRVPVLLALACLASANCGDNQDPPDCPGLPACKDRGLCSVDGDRCVAASDDDCSTRSEVCSKLGRCAARDGICKAVSDGDCKASSFCQIYGGCHAKDGVCLATNEDDCNSSSGCKLYGWCTLNEQGECVKIEK